MHKDVEQILYTEEELRRRVKELGQTSVAITDHGVMYGAIDFYKACKAAGIKPIIGCEVYVAPRTRFDRVHELDGSARHLVLLCRNEEGYRNLSYMVSLAFTEGFYIKPRIDMDLLRERAEGLIGIAHPQFREELIAAAEKMHIWRRSNKR